MLMLPLPLLAVGTPKAKLEDLSDCLKRHAFHLRVEENDGEPANKADATVEAKRSAWRHAFQHNEERRRDDNVRAPASDRIQHRC